MYQNLSGSPFSWIKKNFKPQYLIPVVGQTALSYDIAKAGIKAGKSELQYQDKKKQENTDLINQAKVETAIAEQKIQSVDSIQQQSQVDKMALQNQLQAQQESTKKMMLIGGGGALALALIMMMRK